MTLRTLPAVVPRCPTIVQRCGRYPRHDGWVCHAITFLPMTRVSTAKHWPWSTPLCRRLERLGATIEDVTVPASALCRWRATGHYAQRSFSYHARHLRNRPADYGDMVRARFRIGGLFSAGDYVQAQRVRQVLKRDFATALQHVDAIVSPTMSNPAPAFAGIDAMTTARRPSFTGPYNLTGMPAISVPCGFTRCGFAYWLANCWQAI